MENPWEHILASSKSEWAGVPEVCFIRGHSPSRKLLTFPPILSLPAKWTWKFPMWWLQGHPEDGSHMLRKQEEAWTLVKLERSVLDSHPPDSCTRMGKETFKSYLEMCILFLKAPRLPKAC